MAPHTSVPKWCRSWFARTGRPSNAVRFESSSSHAVTWIRCPVAEVNTPRGVVRFSTPEVTALELVGYPNHSGGLSNVATVVSELAEELDREKLVAAARLSPVSWSQRLGYLLELVGQDALAEALKPFVAKRARSYTPLRRAAGTAGRRSRTWKLIVNVEVEPDL